MSILKQTPGLLEALRGEMTPKFLATRNAQGMPNVVPVVSILPADDQPDTLFFGNFLLRKSIDNLQHDARVGILVITQDLMGWVLKGEFIEFQNTGPYVAQQMNSSLLRYNAYTGVRNAGVIRVMSLEGSFRISKLQVAKDYLLTKLAALGGHPGSHDVVTMPGAVRKEFAKMAAVKVLAWLDVDGCPLVVPILSLQPAGAAALLGRTRPGLPSPPPGAAVASNILTFEAISYQVKGRWEGTGRSGRLFVQEVYAGGPPIPGERIA